ncbi:MAG: hypothetical protein K6C05_07890, partial [Anaerovibrio sp.]|nr:hypothetical protein [Anaerovibrio sp.]
LYLRNTNLLLQEIDAALKDENRKFTFLCGHDTNLVMLLNVLGAGDYHLPETICFRSPIGGKLVFEVRQGKDGGQYIYPYVTYQSDSQLRHSTQLDLAHPPVRYAVNLEGIRKNDDGLYYYDDFFKCMEGAFSKYDYYAGLKDN